MKHAQRLFLLFAVCLLAIAADPALQLTRVHTNMVEFVQSDSPPAAVLDAMESMDGSQQTDARTAISAASAADLAAISDPGLASGIKSWAWPSPRFTRTFGGHGIPSGDERVCWGALVAEPKGSNYTINAVQFVSQPIATSEYVVRVRLGDNDYTTSYSDAIAATNQTRLTLVNTDTNLFYVFTVPLSTTVSVDATNSVWVEVLGNGISKFPSEPHYKFAASPYPYSRHSATTTWPTTLTSALASYATYFHFAIGSYNSARTDWRPTGRAAVIAASGQEPQMLIGSTYPMAEGLPVWIAFDALLSTGTGRVVPYRYGVTSAMEAWADSIRIPSASVTATKALDLYWLTDMGRLVQKKAVTFNYATKGTGGGTAIKWLHLGDSTVALTPERLAQMVTSLSGSRIALTTVGRNSSTVNDYAGVSRTVKHEGLNGRSHSSLILDSPNYFGAPGHATDGTDFSLNYYLTNYCSSEVMSSNDFVVVELGVNSLLTTPSDMSPEMADAIVERDLELCETLITQLQDATDGIPGIGVVFATSRLQLNQDGWRTSSSSGSVKLSQWTRYLAAMRDRLDGRTASRVYWAPAHVCFDSATGFITATAARHPYTTTTSTYYNESVHQNATAGYQQGAFWAAWLLNAVP